MMIFPGSIGVQLLIVFFYFLLTGYFVIQSYLMKRGSNYLPTPRSEIKKILPYIHPGDTVIDLGSGYGEVMETMATRNPKEVIGVELDPIRYLLTRLRLNNGSFRGYKFRFQDFWYLDLSKADVVFTFFIERHMEKLFKKAKHEMKKGSWFISFRHRVPHVVPTKVVGEMLFFKL